LGGPAVLNARPVGEPRQAIVGPLSCVLRRRQQRCCDVSAPRGTVSAAPLPPLKPAIACTSCEVEPELPMEPVGGSAAKPQSCQSKPTAPKIDRLWRKPPHVVTIVAKPGDSIYGPTARRGFDAGDVATDEGPAPNLDRLGFHLLLLSPFPRLFPD